MVTLRVTVAVSPLTKSRRLFSIGNSSNYMVIRVTLLSEARIMVAPQAPKLIAHNKLSVLRPSPQANISKRKTRSRTNEEIKE